jgi:hypothetical protein
LDTKYAEYNSLRLANPFRLFTRAQVHFSSSGKGKHLDRVEMWADDFDSAKYTWQSYATETENTVRMIEKKFGIKFERFSGPANRSYFWSHEKDGKKVEEIVVGLEGKFLRLNFSSYLVRELEKQQLEASKKSIALDVDAGADQL